MAHEAETASPTRAGGAPSWPKITGFPSSSRTAQTQSGRAGQTSPNRAFTPSEMADVGTVPSGRSPAMSDAGRTCHGRRAAARTTRGAAGPQAGRPRRGDRWCRGWVSPTGAMRAAPLAERGEPSTMAAMSPGDSPARSAAAATDPADVPIRISAALGSQPIPSASPERTPAWKARPASPPALNTTPIRAVMGQEQTVMGTTAVIGSRRGAGPCPLRSPRTSRRGPRWCHGPR